HRVRIAVSTSYWPLAWPSPEPVLLSLFTGASRLELPVRGPRGEDDRLRPFGEPEAAPPPEHTALAPARLQRTIERDLSTNETVYTTFVDGGDFGAAGLARVDAIDLELGHSIRKRFRVRDDPLSARAEIEQETRLSRGGWSARVETRTAFRATRETFELHAELRAFEGESAVFERIWDQSIPRDGV
ncbi:MAG: CocE/NonD family hydrolase, partial [Candidatus Binatia bacterium]